MEKLKKITNHHKVLKSVMERYGGLSTLRTAMCEDPDTVLVNINDDLEVELDEDNLLLIIQNLLK